MAEIEVRFKDLLSSYLTKFSFVNRETARRAWQGGGFGVTNFTDTGALDPSSVSTCAADVCRLTSDALDMPLLCC